MTIETLITKNFAAPDSTLPPIIPWPLTDDSFRESDEAKLFQEAEAAQAVLPGTLKNPVATVKQQYRPTEMVMREDQKQNTKDQSLSSKKYLGNVNTRGFKSQIRNLPGRYNCALWITNIPIEADYTDVLNAIHEGAVASLHLNSPNEEFHNQAAKLVFKEPESAAAFLRRSRDREGIQIKHMRIRATYNRFGYTRHTKPWQSRVIHIEVPVTKEFVNIWNWVKYFNKLCVHHGTARYVDIGNPERVVIEFQFARIQGQAQCCLLAIEKEPVFKGLVKVTYGPDPCDPEAYSPNE